MPLRSDIKKVLVIGSGPIVIGQAAEFDYAGTQACRALKAEGLEVVLINSNPATIMTDKDKPNVLRETDEGGVNRIAATSPSRLGWNQHIRSLSEGPERFDEERRTTWVRLQAGWRSSPAARRRSDAA